MTGPASATPGSDGTAPVWWQFGRDAILVEFADAADRWAFRCPGADELVVGARTVLVRYDPARHRAADLMAGAHLGAERSGPGRTHTVPVVYDGPDLAAMARARGLSTAELVARHSAITYRAEFCGFAPGFAYLSGLDPVLHQPRLTTPRTRVPRGAVAVADSYCAVYPTDSPGGWNLLGHTTTTLFDAAATQPALISPGDLVRFEVVT